MRSATCFTMQGAGSVLGRSSVGAGYIGVGLVGTARWHLLGFSPLDVSRVDSFDGDIITAASLALACRRWRSWRRPSWGGISVFGFGCWCWLFGCTYFCFRGGVNIESANDE